MNDNVKDDAEMIKNMELLMAMDLLEQDKDWETLQNLDQAETESDDTEGEK